MKQEILDAGWEYRNIERLPKFRTFYQRGNYWLILDEGERFNSGPYIEISVRDPSLHATEVGDNLTIYLFSFKWRGSETVEAINKLLF